MQRTWTTDLAAHTGGTVLLKGWLHHFRRLSRVSFLLLRDGRGVVQVVVDSAESVATLAALHHEAVIEIEGDVVAVAQAPNGVEVRARIVRVLVAPPEEPPVDLSRRELQVQLPTLLDHAPVTLRHPRQRAAFRLADAAMAGFRASLRSRDFVEIQTPKIVAAATEGGANVFMVDYFGRPTYLAQSPQFYKQTMVGVFERVFEVGPVFRAEPHDTQRHVNEYVSLDAEFGFIDDHRTVMVLLRDVLADMLGTMAADGRGALAELAIDLPVVPASIPCVHFTEAQKLITAETGEDLSGEPDLAPAHESLLGAWAMRETGSDFLFVTGYPMVKRPFYTHPDPERPTFSNSFDLLFRGVELVTGGQRLHRYDDYLAALGHAGHDAAPFEGYLQAFRHGMPPHGGFAIGLERLLARVTGASNIREVTLFPRDLGRVTP